MSETSAHTGTAPAKRAVIPCDLPEFRQSLDKSRPAELLDETAWGKPTTTHPKLRMHLRYRYKDNGEIVVVPNAPYNLTPSMRAAQVRWMAKDREERAAHVLENLPVGWKPWMAQQIADRYRANAALIRQVADQIEAGTAPWDARLGIESEQFWWPREARALDAAPGTDIPDTDTDSDTTPRERG
jgi:hypothetical protein